MRFSSQGIEVRLGRKKHPPGTDLFRFPKNFPEPFDPCGHDLVVDVDTTFLTGDTHQVHSPEDNPVLNPLRVFNKLRTIL